MRAVTLLPALAYTALLSLLAACGGGEGGAATISAKDGGAVAGDDGRVTVEIPPGALSEDTAITITAIFPDELPPEISEPGDAGPTYRLEPQGLEVSEPVTVRVHLSGEDLGAEQAAGGVIAYALLTQGEDGAPELLQYLNTRASLTDGSVEVRGELSRFGFIHTRRSFLRLELEPVEPRERAEGVEFQVAVSAERFQRGESPISISSAAVSATEPLKIVGSRGIGAELVLAGAGDFRQADASDSTSLLAHVVPSTGAVAARVTLVCDKPPGRGVYTVDASAQEGGETVSVTIDAAVECAGPSPQSPRATATATATAAPTASATPTATGTPTPTLTSTPAPTATATRAPAPARTRVRTPTPSRTPTPTPTPRPTAAPGPTSEPTTAPPRPTPTPRPPLADNQVSDVILRAAAPGLGDIGTLGRNASARRSSWEASVPVGTLVRIEVISVDGNLGPDDTRGQVTFMASLDDGDPAGHVEGAFVPEAFVPPLGTTDTVSCTGPAGTSTVNPGDPLQASLVTCPTNEMIRSDGSAGTVESALSFVVDQPTPQLLSIGRSFNFRCLEPGLHVSDFYATVEPVPPTTDPDLANNYWVGRLFLTCVAPTSGALPAPYPGPDSGPYARAHAYTRADACTAVSEGQSPYGREQSRT